MSRNYYYPPVIIYCEDQKAALPQLNKSDIRYTKLSNIQAQKQKKENNPMMPSTFSTLVNALHLNNRFFTSSENQDEQTFIAFKNDTTTLTVTWSSNAIIPVFE